MKPKIIATLGTTTDDARVLEEMVKHGMSCARINTAYATLEDYSRRVNLLRLVKEIDVMMDLKGPQVRINVDKNYELKEGAKIFAGFEDENIHFSHRFYDDLKKGDILLIENGTIRTEIEDKKDGLVELKVIEPGEGELRNHMGINVPGRYLHTDKLSIKDMEVIGWSLKNDVTQLALSFVRDFGDIKNLHDIVKEFNQVYRKEMPTLVAKIEDIYGMQNLPDILQKSKAEGIKLQVMVARGDLYVERPLAELPIAQDYIITTCKQYDVPVITGTGVFESMQYANEPSRAEYCDVFHSMVLGTDAFMLSGETSNGKHPAKVVQYLSDALRLYSSYKEGYYELKEETGHEECAESTAKA